MPSDACAIAGLVTLSTMLAQTGSAPISRPLVGATQPSAKAAAPGGQAAPPAIEKYLSKEAIFLLYKPKGWLVNEASQPTFRTINVADPAGACEAAMFFGTNPLGNDSASRSGRG